MRVLITGITGFVGSHMADYLLKNVPDVKIFATRRWRSKEDNIKHLFGKFTRVYNRRSQFKVVSIGTTDEIE